MRAFCSEPEARRDSKRKHLDTVTQGRPHGRNFQLTIANTGIAVVAACKDGLEQRGLRAETAGQEVYVHTIMQVHAYR